jgi:ubiquinone/menaquinone biosynthesis C-methylase UbiE
METEIDWRDLCKLKVAETYNNAATHFDDGPLAFWEVYGRRTIELLHLPPGATVLDVGCGSGASALRAAEVVGPRGSVIGIDLAAKLLERARIKAAQRHLENVTFTLGDMTNLGSSDEQFDAVVSVFSLFFVADMETQVQELWHRVRPGGKLAITTWGPRLFEPVYGRLQEIIRVEQSALCSLCNSWQCIATPESLRQLLVKSGVPKMKILFEEGRQSLRSPEDWWTIVLGSGLRGPIDEMNGEVSARVRQANIAWVRNHKVASVETNVLYAIAAKDPD